MKWALKFSTKGKGAGGGPDAGKAYPGSSSGNFRNGGGGGLGGDTNGARGGEAGVFRSSSDGEGPGGEYYEDQGLEPGQERDTPIVTPPDAANGGGGRGAASRGGGGGGPDAQHHQRGGEKYEGPGDENSSATYEEDDEHNNGSSAPHFTVDSAGRQQREGEEEGEDMDYEDERRQQDVFDEDGDSQADSLQASKTARMKSFADDPEAHVLEDNAEWEGEIVRRLSPGRTLAGVRGVVCLEFCGHLFSLLYPTSSSLIGFPFSPIKSRISSFRLTVCVCLGVARTKKFGLFWKPVSSAAAAAAASKRFLMP